uniref:Portal protein n=1 Tax=viral metagenome TaxID=1070528 RepID=A0A6H1ZHX9_9ZZZZ
MAEKEKTEKKSLFPESEREAHYEEMARLFTDHPVVKEHHGKWKELIEWTDKGNQFSIYDDDTGQMIAVPLEKRRKKIVVNMMKPLSEAIEGKINMNYRLVGSPGSGEDDDLKAANVSTALLSFNDYENGVEELMEDIKYDLIRTGNACLKVHYTKGKKGKIQGKDGKVVEVDGGIVMEVPSIFNVRPDSTATTRKNQRTFVEYMEMTEDAILETYDVTEEELRTHLLGSGDEGAKKYAGMYEIVEEKDKEEDTYIVALYWEAKTTKYPNGRHIISTGALTLWEGENKQNGEIPYFMFGYKRCGNSPWSTGPMHHVQGLQRNFNRFVSMIVEHVEGWRAKLAAPPGAIEKDGAFTSGPFEIVETDPSRGNITVVPTPPLSPEIPGLRDFFESAFGKVSNIHEVTYAQLPQYASRAPASLYAMMLEQENLKLDPMLKRMNRVVVDIGKFRLRLFDKYYTQPRLVRVLGKGEAQAIEFFKGSDLNGNFDVQLDIGISMHQSRTVQQRLLLELHDKGLIKDSNKILKMLQLGGIEQELRSDIIDEERATRENQLYINDKYKLPFHEGGVKVYIHDDHDVHLRYHSTIAKTPEAQKWPIDKWDHLQEHMTDHLAILQLLNTASQNIQGGLPGGKGGGGAPAEEEDTGMGQPGPVPEEAEVPTQEVQVEEQVTNQ